MFKIGFKGKKRHLFTMLFSAVILALFVFFGFFQNYSRAGDVIPPLISNPMPSGTISSKQTAISVQTDEPAICRYGSEDKAYAQLPSEFSTTGGTIHRSDVYQGYDLEERRYIFYVKCRDASSNESSSIINFIVDYDYDGQDNEPPFIFNPLPQGNVYQKNVAISVETNEECICRYSSSDRSYDLMPEEFDTFEGRTHVKIFTVPSLGSYIYYVRCKDNSGNQNETSVKIEFKVLEDSNDEDDDDPPVIFDPEPGGTVIFDEIILMLETNEKADCKYSLSDQSYDTMPDFFGTTDNYFHFKEKTLDSEGDHVYYVRCKDEFGNKNTSSSKISFIFDPYYDDDDANDDANDDDDDANDDDDDANDDDDDDDDAGREPEITNLLPKGTIYQQNVLLKVETDRKTVCHFALSDKSYDLMENTFENTGGYTHSDNEILSSQGQYVYYVRCKDSAGNKNSISAEIIFNYSSTDTTAPVLSKLEPSGIIYDKNMKVSVQTDEPASCRFSLYDKVYDKMVGILTAKTPTYHEASLTLPAFGQYVYYVRCKDEVGNKSLVSQTISFTYSKKIDNDEKKDETPPVISNPQPSGIIDYNSINLLVATNESASCRYSAVNISYDSMANHFTADYGTKHKDHINLSKEGQYTYYVRCKDSAGNINSTPTIIKFEFKENKPEEKIPPLISDLKPSSNIYQDRVVLFLSTDKKAICRYDTKDKDYDEMENIFSTNDGLLHQKTVELKSFGSYTYYCRCKDEITQAQNSESKNINFKYLDLDALPEESKEDQQNKEKETEEDEKNIDGESLDKEIKILEEDGKCEDKENGECDPDCEKGKDPDCAKIQKSSFSWLIFLIIPAIIVIGVVIFFVLKKRREGAEKNDDLSLE